jgi:hypothetical protein
MRGMCACLNLWAPGGSDERNVCMFKFMGDRGSKVVKVLRYKAEGRWFDPRWCHWNFSLILILLIALWPWGRLSL